MYISIMCLVTFIQCYSCIPGQPIFEGIKLHGYIFNGHRSGEPVHVCILVVE